MWTRKQLVASGSDTFLKIQKIMKSARALNIDQESREFLRDMFKHYESLILSHVQFLHENRVSMADSDRTTSGDDDEEEDDDQTKGDSPERWSLYFWMWHLCGIVFQINNKRVLVRDAIISWLASDSNALNKANTAHQTFLDLVHELQALESVRSTERIDRELIKPMMVCLAHGNLSFVDEQIELLAEIYPSFINPLNEVGKVIRAMPEIQRFKDEGRFKRVYDEWRAACLNLSSQLTDSSLSDLKIILEILSGNQSVIFQTFSDDLLLSTFASIIFVDPLVTNSSIRFLSLFLFLFLSLLIRF